MKNEIDAKELKREEPLPRLTPDVDLIDRGDSFELRADMPGVKNEDLDLGVEDYVLHLSGISRCEDPQGYRAAVREFGDCEYRIAYRLAKDIDVDKIQAKIENGVLTVRLPKQEERQPKKIKVEVE